MSNSNKEDDKNSREKKVRFSNDIQTKTIEEDYNNNFNNSNDNYEQNETKVNNGDDNFEKEILKQIEIGNEKQKKRDEEFKEKNKIQDLSKEHKYKEDVINNQIDSVQGEVYLDSDDDENQKKEVEKIYKKVRGKRALFKNDDEYSDDDNDKMNDKTKKSDNNNNDEEEEEEEEEEIEYDSFNLKDENEQGYFDASGNFVFRKDKKEDDAWLQEYDQVWSTKVPKISKRDLKKQNDQQTEEEEDLWEIEHQKELKKRRLGQSNDEKSLRLERLNKIYNILQSDKESVLSALRRLSGNPTGSNKRPEIKRKNPPKNKRSNTDTTSTTTTTTTTTQSESDKKLFNQLTELADTLLSNGFVNIYSETKYSINETFKKENYQPLP
ncbi:hypothetical protein RB653_007297 [Dictyostelium firmibasis]|uniref:GYF domain-containing protein n=1 Tax=Dictyostelium firmibasis TaxID=79012 RepID=A0AAN7YR39_9MYCE